MTNRQKLSLIGLISSVIAVVITVISMIISGFNGSQTAIFCCIIAIFLSNLSVYSSQKKKDKDDSK